MVRDLKYFLLFKMDSSFTDLIRAQLSIDAVALAKAHADVQVSEGNIFDHLWTLIVQREGAALEQVVEEIKKPFFVLHFLIPFTNSYIALLQIPGLVPRPIV